MEPPKPGHQGPPDRPAPPDLRAAAALTAAAQALIGPTNRTPVDVAQESGVDLDLARRFWRALGFPPVADDQPFFAAADVAMLRAAADLVSRADTDAEVVLQMTRVIGQSLARIAEAQLTAAAVRPVDGGATSHFEVGRFPVAAVETLVRGVEPFLGYVWRRHLLAALARLATAQDSGIAEGHEMAVGFADMVGFTAISQQLEERQLATLVLRFEELASDRIAQVGGRVVKMIGDEVMFATDSLSDAAHIALDLVEAHLRDSDLPDLRVGLAFGPTLSWEGDLFGPTVNLASRLVNIARPSSVLVDPLAARHLAADAAFRLRPLRRVWLKGIGRVRVTSLRRPQATP